MQGLENYKVYHYTDLNAFINIIRNEDIVLRATNCLYLNDSNEIVEGVKSVERVIQKKIDVGPFVRPPIRCKCGECMLLMVLGAH